MTKSIVSPKNSTVKVSTLEDLVKNCCSVCGYPLTVTTSWSKGIPYAVCTRVDGGYAHLRQQISLELYDEFWDYQVAQLQEEDFGIHEEDNCEEARND